MLSYYVVLMQPCSFFNVSTLNSMPQTPHFSPLALNATPSPPHKSCEKETRKRSSPTSPIFVNECIDSQSTSYNSCSPKWVRLGRWMDLAVWLSKVAFNKSRSKTSSVVTLVRFYISRPPLPQICADPHHSIVEYVTCKTCKSFDTLLTKENRIFFMSCMSCGSRRSVSAIKSGFQAQVGKRIKK